MKNRNFFLAAAASILALAACNKEIDYGPAKVEVDKAEIEVAQGAGSVTVSLNATMDWAAKVDGDDADWLDISPASGGPSLEPQTLTVKFTENTEFDREASILIQGDVLHKTYVNVKQAGAKGDPSVVTQITVKEFLEKKDLDREYILEGKISGVANSSYKGFDLTDETGTVACAFPVNFDDFASKLKDDGVVRIQGKYAFYEPKQTHQMENGTILAYEAPMAVDPSTIETISIKDFLDKADPKTTYRLVGTVTGYNSQYCSFDLKDDSASIYVYKIDDASKAAFADKLANGKKVTLTGKYLWYENKNDASKSKAEINPATIEKVEEGEDGGDDGAQGGAPTEFTKATIAEFLAAPVSNSKWYQLTGEIIDIANTTYGNFTIKDETGEVYVYGLTKTYVEKNDKSFASLGLKKGDIVTLNGLRGEYNGTIETAGTPPAFYVSHVSGEDGEDGGEDTGDDGSQGGAPTQFTKATIAEFIAAPVSNSKWYQLTGEITNIANTTYGNFTIKDETGEVYIYGLTKAYVPENDKSFASLGLKKGDIVTLNGLRGEYNGTIETAGTPPAFYVSHTAGEGETFPEGSVILSFPDDNSSSNGLTTKQYETEWTAKSGSNEFKIFAFNNNGWKNDWSYIRAGRKSAESTATIATSTKIAAKISKVVVTFDSIETGDVKSVKVISASDAAFTTDVAEVSVTPAQGDVEFKIAAPAGNKYYKLVIDCKASSKDRNGFVQVSRVAYIAAE